MSYRFEVETSGGAIVAEVVCWCLSCDLYGVLTAATYIPDKKLVILNGVSLSWECHSIDNAIALYASWLEKRPELKRQSIDAILRCISVNIELLVYSDLLV